MRSVVELRLLEGLTAGAIEADGVEVEVTSPNMDSRHGIFEDVGRDSEAEAWPVQAGQDNGVVGGHLRMGRMRVDWRLGRECLG